MTAAPRGRARRKRDARTGTAVITGPGDPRAVAGPACAPLAMTCRASQQRPRAASEPRTRTARCAITRWRSWSPSPTRHMPGAARWSSMPTRAGINNSIEAGIDQIRPTAFIDEAGVRGIRERGLFYMPTRWVTCDKNIAAWLYRPWMAEEMQQAPPRAPRIAARQRVVFITVLPSSSAKDCLWRPREMGIV